MQLTVLQPATGKREPLEVEASQLTAAALPAAVARCLQLPLITQAHLRLLSGGQPLNDDAAVSRLKDGDTVLAVVAPKPPPKAVREAVAGVDAAAAADDEADDPLRLRLPANAPAWKRRGLHFLRHRLHVPEALLALALRPGLRFWCGLALWACGARLAASYDLGPPFIICTIFGGILLNLGTRQEGQWSAYSIFNPGMRRLPGQMTAEDLDAQVRRGAM